MDPVKTNRLEQNTERNEVQGKQRSISQWGLIVRRFRKHQVAMVSLWILGIFVVFALFAEFLIPNSPFQQFSGTVYVPPRSVRFFDSNGNFQRPFIYGYQQELDRRTFERVWTENEEEIYPIFFFVRGFEYNLLGLFSTDLHLIGLEEGAPPLLLFGSDRLGRDVYSRIIYATRISLSIALVGVVISVFLSVLLGGVAGYYGGLMDNLVQRISELLLSVPTLPLWMGLAAAVPPNWPIVRVYVALVVIISFMSWPWMARGIRSKIISLRQEDYVNAAVSYGASDSWIIFRHLMPNVLSYIIVSITLAIPGMILLETALSFLGLGLRAPAVSWGVLLQAAQNFQAVILYPWLLLPGAFVVMCILSLNFIGDGLRDAADPYEKT